MSIATELTRIQTAKADIKASIEAKGVTVPSNALIDEYADYVDEIQTGGGGGQAEEDLKNLIERDITSITIPSGTTKIGTNAFAGCSGLKRLTIPSGVTSIGDYAFSYCGLTSVTIPSGVTSIGESAFNNCYSLTSVTIGSGVTSIGERAFNNCTRLTSVTIPNTVKTIGRVAFNNCTRLTSVTIPSGVTSIGDFAFEACSKLTSVTVEATTPPTLGGNVFISNATGRKIYVPAESVDTYKTAANWSTYAADIEAINDEAPLIDEGL